MRTGRPKQPLILTEEEHDRLESLAHRARSQPLLARRARVGLACGEGLDNKTVARKLRVSLGMVGKWRSRFLKARLEGLYDEPRPGAPRKVSDAEVEQVVIQTLESTPRAQTHWSTRGLAKTTGLSRMTISRIWHAFGLQPHRSETFKLSPDQVVSGKSICTDLVVRLAKENRTIGPVFSVRSSFRALRHPSRRRGKRSGRNSRATNKRFSGLRLSDE